MSTKAIRRALDEVRDAEPGSSDGSQQREIYEAALAEVEAIERAAATITIQGIYELPEGETADVQAAIVSAETLMRSIAEEAS